MMHSGILVLTLVLLGTYMASGTKSTGTQTLDVEAAVCGTFREPFMFWLWHTLAGFPHGKSRLAAIVADYQELVAHLNTQGYAQQFLYGISMGGVILLDAIGESPAYTRLVVDSSPSRISPLGCPERYDPVRHLPEDSARIMIISGAQDRVVTPRQMAELISEAGRRGARVLQDQDFAHPYQDAAAQTHQRRLDAIAAFLLPEQEQTSSKIR